MTQKFWGAPLNIYGWLSFIIGVIGCTLYSIHLFWGIGISSLDYAVMSLIIIVLLLLAVAYNIVHFRYAAGKIQNPNRTVLSITFMGVLAVCLIVFAVYGLAMSMDMGAMEHAERDIGVFTGFRMLAHITERDITTLENWSLGVSAMIKGLFLIIPFLIVTWGALACLTASSMADMQGALFSLVAAMFFTIEVWMFKIVDVILTA